MPRKTVSGESARAGHFDIEYRQGSAWLTVYPPAGNGRQVYPEQVLNRMKILRIPATCLPKVEHAVRAADGVPMELIEWPQGADLCSKIDIEISDDQMSATVIIHPPKKGGGAPSEDDLLKILADAGIRSGIIHEALQELASKRLYDTQTIVAKGQPVRHG
ncbi:MAG: DUF342 domain-containing protein, partial [Spirochaetales bacterium]|nr:DUF342 domain-containing protein [Spirochaetales bacterium]